MKIVILNDMHLPEINTTPQYAYFEKALENIRLNEPELVVVNGDITACGEENSANFYLSKIKNVRTITLLGNSDVRTPEAEKILRPYSLTGFSTTDCKRRILCINTPHAHIGDREKQLVEAMQDGDIVITHYSVSGLDEDSRNFIKNVFERKAIVYIHAHTHNFQDYTIGSSRIVCLRALDPDKSIGDVPCITYVDITDEEVLFREEKFYNKNFEADKFRDLLGISCFDIEKTVDFAIEKNVRNLEIRKYSEGDGQLDLICEKVSQWRKKCGTNLSIHMPNVRYDGEIICKDWEYASRIIEKTRVNMLTIHPPRVSVKMMQENDVFTKFYVDFIKKLPNAVAVGIENLHMSQTSPTDENRQFGCIPEELCAFVDNINKHFGFERVGIVLDVGHARNNPPFNSEYTLGMWYELVGKRTTAYHIHQVKRTDGKLKNHTGLDNWFGPMISYASFFYAWQNSHINRQPMFMEMRQFDDVVESLCAYDSMPKF